ARICPQITPRIHEALPDRTRSGGSIPLTRSTDVQIPPTTARICPQITLVLHGLGAPSPITLVASERKDPTLRDVNIWAVLLGTLSCMVVGSIWYTPAVVGNRWMDLARIDRDATEQSAVGPIVVTVIVSRITAYVLTAA